MILILGSRSNSTLAEFEKFLEERELANLFVTHDDIVTSLEINDSIGRLGALSIKWKLKNNNIDGLDIRGALNYLDYLPARLFEDFIVEDREYVRSEFNAYLLFALGNMRNVVNRPWGGGLSGFCQSLIFQWESISKYEGLATPKYFLGYERDLPDSIKKSVNIVRSENPFDGYNWNTNRTHGKSESRHYLFYIRPSGTPIICSICKDKIWYNRQDSLIVDNLNKMVLIELMSKMKLDLATVLLFSDHKTGRITFGSISPLINASNLSEQDKLSFFNYLCDECFS